MKSDSSAKQRNLPKKPPYLKPPANMEETVNAGTTSSRDESYMGQIRLDK